jgi:hypothetical protein
MRFAPFMSGLVHFASRLEFGINWLGTPAFFRRSSRVKTCVPFWEIRGTPSPTLSRILKDLELCDGSRPGKQRT